MPPSLISQLNGWHLHLSTQASRRDVWPSSPSPSYPNLKLADSTHLKVFQTCHLLCASDTYVIISAFSTSCLSYCNTFLFFLASILAPSNASSWKRKAALDATLTMASDIKRCLMTGPYPASPAVSFSHSLCFSKPTAFLHMICSFSRACFCSCFPLWVLCPSNFGRTISPLKLKKISPGWFCVPEHCVLIY